jgi:hypothetical protein
MSDSTSQAGVRPLRPSDGGVLTSAIALGADTIERALQSSFETAEAVRRETFHVTYAAVELVDTVQQSVLKVVRESLGGLDKASALVTERLGGTVLAFARTIRGSGELAGEIVARTAESLTGRSSPAKAA